MSRWWYLTAGVCSNLSGLLVWLMVDAKSLEESESFAFTVAVILLSSWLALLTLTVGREVGIWLWQRRLKRLQRLKMKNSSNPKRR